MDTPSSSTLWRLNVGLVILGAASGIMGAFFSPLLAWIGMRRVPLWRAFTEPAVG